ncbi:MAG: TetR/AcrR family transcriptional regulator [Candidatus Binatia bacterium]|nr:TetR/AcrR family transcriptional regulator [Candidatus Binatia bacterium]
MPRTATGPKLQKRGNYAKTAETRGKILAAVRDAAEELGFHEVSLSNVASRAGVAVGNVSYHFGSREELLREVMQSVGTELQRDVVLAGADEGDLFARGEAGIRAYLRFIHEHPSHARLREQVRHHHPEIYRANLAKWVELQRAAIRQGVDEGTLRPMSDDDISATAYLITGAHYFLDQMIEGIDGTAYPGDDVVVAAYMKLFRGGLEQSRRRKS